MKFATYLALIGAASAIRSKDDKAAATAAADATKTAAAGTNAYKADSHKFEDLPEKTGGLQARQHFQIKSRMNGNFVAYVTHPLILNDWGVETKQHLVKTRAPEFSAEEFWFYHEKTDSIRSVSNSNLALSVSDEINKAGPKKNKEIVAKPWVEGMEQ